MTKKKSERKRAEGKVAHVTDRNFEAEVLESKLPVLVDFTAVWCGPCKLMAPIIKQIAGEYVGRVKVGKLDVDKSVATPGKYKVMYIPTLALFVGGKVRARSVGLVSKAKIEKMLAKVP
jgi:thioredoxin 1